MSRLLLEIMETQEFRLFLMEIVEQLREIKNLLEESRDARMVLEQSTKLLSQEDAGSIPALGAISELKLGENK